jgi:hypothetical protein
VGERVSEWLHRVSTGWVALAAMVIFLYLENLSTSLVMLRYPDHTPVYAGQMDLCRREFRAVIRWPRCRRMALDQKQKRKISFPKRSFDLRTWK